MAPHGPKAIRVDADQYAELQRAADEAGRSAAEELRQRLAASFERDRELAADLKLAELQRRIGELADVIQSWGVGADWHSNAFAFEAFKAGIAALLDVAGRPAGEVALPPGSLLKPGDDPAAIGRVLARAVSEKAAAQSTELKLKK